MFWVQIPTKAQDTLSPSATGHPIHPPNKAKKNAQVFKQQHAWSFQLFRRLFAVPTKVEPRQSCVARECCRSFGMPGLLVTRKSTSSPFVPLTSSCCLRPFRRQDCVAFRRGGLCHVKDARHDTFVLLYGISVLVIKSSTKKFWRKKTRQKKGGDK